MCRACCGEIVEETKVPGDTKLGVLLYTVEVGSRLSYGKGRSEVIKFTTFLVIHPKNQLRIGGLEPGIKSILAL
jgi:hypothetical protein